jgi:Tol biopolymer transport system component
MLVLAAVAVALALQPANPTWTSDGTRVAYANLGSSSARGELVVAYADGSGRHVVYKSDTCCEPVLGAAGSRIVFVSNFQLYAVGAGGGKVTPLALSPGFNTPWFTLSPNRETIAFDDGCACGHSPDSVALVGVRAGGRPFVVARPKKTTDSIDGFSPDGTLLVFTRAPWDYNGASKGKPVLMAQSVRGGRAVPLARSGLIGASSVPSNALWPQWSPDGKWVAFIVPRPTPRLELLSTSGGAPSVLVPKLSGLSSFSWSPTSTRIAFGQYGHQTDALATVDLQGHETVVSGSLVWVSNDSWDRPQWSPDGSRLTFMVRRGGIWVVGADGTGLKQIA